MADLKVALQELKDESESGRLAAAHPAAPARKRAAWVWVACAALVVLTTAGIWLAGRSHTPAPAQTLVSVTTYRGSEREPCFSPDGNQIAFSWDGEKDGNRDIYVSLLGEPTALR